jgi:hypothetical protein
MLAAAQEVETAAESAGAGCCWRWNLAAGPKTALVATASWCARSSLMSLYRCCCCSSGCREHAASVDSGDCIVNIRPMLRVAEA